MVSKSTIALIACCLPLLLLGIDIATDNRGGNPIESLHIRLGDWSLRFLCLTLAITPIQAISKWRGMATYRQLFGLCSFAYASLHLLVYLLVDNSLNWRLIWIDLLESPYIWFGVLCFLLVTTLAITSPKYAKKKLGKYWKKIHRLIYPACVFALIHYFWQLKGNLIQPIFYTALIGLLMLFRVLAWLKRKRGLV